MLLNATFARELDENQAPIDPTETFPPEGPIYLSLEFEGRPESGLVKAEYYYQDQYITEATVDFADVNSGVIFSVGENTFVGFTLEPDQPFPAGDEYTVETFVNDEPLGTYTFSIESSGAEPPAETTDDTAGGTAVLLNATFARELDADQAPIDPTDTFPPEGPIYLSLEFEGRLQSGIVTAVYYYQDELITETSIDLADTTLPDAATSTFVGFSLAPNQPFPVGDEYTVEVYLDDGLLDTYTFSIGE
ncbi:MAG: hypothetical protein HC893_09040 [Chloroflexaceae bacterium]|nr:hypothetical protein [Chloroflexaceae bacterium]